MRPVEQTGPSLPMAGPAPDLSWLDRGLAWRDRLLASHRFQRWAATFPLTRPVAQRRTRELFDICGGFVYSQVLFACVQLRLFEILAEGPATAPVLAGRLSLSPEATARLLGAAVSLRLVEHRGKERFGLGPLGAAMVDNPAIVAMIEHHSMLYADLADPVALLRGEGGETALARYWSYARAENPAGLGTTEVAAYTTLMATSQLLVAQDIVDAYQLAKHGCLLDVGGGDGTFLTSVAAATPGLRLMLFDLPPVAERAAARFAAAGLADRSRAVGGSFLSDALPEGADIISLVRVVHDHDDDSAMALLRAVRRALPPDGTLLLAEPMSGTSGAEPVGEAYFGFYLLAMGSGRPRTPDQLEKLLRAAGFDRIQLLRTRRPLLTRLIVARASGLAEAPFST